MTKKWTLIFAIVLSLQQSATGLLSVETLQKCCSIGTKFAEEGNKCSKFDKELMDIPASDMKLCIGSVDICCKNKQTEFQCSEGKKMALQKLKCVSSEDTGDDLGKGCCEACKLGITTGSQGQSCNIVLNFGPLYDAAFSTCCEEISQTTEATSSTSSTVMTTVYAKSTTLSTTQSTLASSILDISNATNPLVEGKSTIEERSTTPVKDFPGANTTLGVTSKVPFVVVEVCDMCAQLCYPIEKGNRCDCYKGFTLMKDGVSCKPVRTISRCTKPHPCEHDCADTGTSIQCSCRIGYKLGEDKKSCIDIDECQLGIHKCLPNETCVNYEGDYDCEDSFGEDDYVDPTCPTGFKFDGDNQLCNDIDECEFSLTCQKPKTCINTIGSFICEGGETPNCPPGFYYKEAIEDCADIDECITGENDCNRESQICLNAIGNYTCIDKASRRTCPPGFKKGLTVECEDINECEETPQICNEEEECINEPGGHSCLAKLPKPTMPLKFSTPVKPSNTPTAVTTQQTTNATASLPTLVFLTTEKPTILPLYSPNQQPTINPSTNTASKNQPETTIFSTKPTFPSFVHIPTPITRRPFPPPFRPPTYHEPNNRINPVNNVDNQPVSCSTGYRYSPVYRECMDIDECQEDNHCDSTQDCYNTPGSFVCNCRSGYTKEFHTGACVDVNECQVGSHDCLDGQRCDNTIGSFLCSRTAGCGTGYTLNYASGLCEDDDECALGTHTCADLGPKFQCRNTFGSYRCDLIPTTIFKFTPRVPPIISGIQRKCLPGYYMSSTGQCEDIDECQSSPCRRNEKCLNLNGRFKCIPSIICTSGFEINENGDGCIDINECARGIHKCGATKICKNGPGFYICECPPGHKQSASGDCVDIDECQLYRGRICSHYAECINTVGSYQCRCKNGFRGNGTSCVDINECQEQHNLCEQTCINNYGSYRCSCKSGFTLNSDNRTCTDIDECSRFKGLCIGTCDNIPGSYKCSCPEGYRLGLDGRTCQDIDECEQNPCTGPDQICFNMRGGYRCPAIRCPTNYQRDPKHRSRCKRYPSDCNVYDTQCNSLPQQYTYHFVTLVSNYVAPKRIDFFQLTGPEWEAARTDFYFSLKNVQCPHHVKKADKSYFTLTKKSRSALLGIVKPIEGPQDIEIQLDMDLYVNNVFNTKIIAKVFLLVSAYPF